MAGETVERAFVGGGRRSHQGFNSGVISISGREREVTPRTSSG